MATAEIFEFFTGTNLLTNPVRRFEPQPILPDTPDVWYVRANVQSGQIRLPYLDKVTGPLYDGKTVTIVIDNINAGFFIFIDAWDGLGNTVAPGVVLGVPNIGESYTVIATWDEISLTGFWQLIKN
jgi:hypothetical protein